MSKTTWTSEVRRYQTGGGGGGVTWVARRFPDNPISSEMQVSGERARGRESQRERETARERESQRERERQRGGEREPAIQRQSQWRMCLNINETAHTLLLWFWNDTDFYYLCPENRTTVSADDKR